jgi:hypothetical protein
MKIKNWIEFNEAVQEPQSEVQAEVKAKEKTMKPKTLNKYQLFFQGKLKKYGVKGIGQLGDKRSQFFKEIKSDWAKQKGVQEED